jgi:ABC-type Zn uptake system ZnuABC Zn-binding protein ZnuA
VGGPAVRVTPVVKAGTDPHDFQPSPRDVGTIESSDLVLLTGKALEGYLTKLEEALGNKAKFVDVGAEIPSLTLEEEGPDRRRSALVAQHREHEKGHSGGSQALR